MKSRYIFLCLYLLISPNLKSQEQLRYDLNKLQVVTESLPPYQIEENDIVYGVTVDKVRTLFDDLGVRPEIQVMPWARAYRTALTKPNTVIFSMVRTPAREDKFHWLGVVAKTKTFLISMGHRSDIKITFLSDLNNYRVGVKRHDVVYEYLKQHDLLHSAVVLPETSVTIEMLIKGRIDVIAASPVHLSYMCKKLNCATADFSFLFELEDLNSDFYIAANKNTSLEVVNLLKQTLNQANEQE